MADTSSPGASARFSAKSITRVRGSPVQGIGELSEKGSVLKEGESKAMALVELGWLIRIGPFVCATVVKAQVRTSNNNAGERMGFFVIDFPTVRGRYLKAEFKSQFQLRTIQLFVAILLQEKSARGS